MVACLLGHQGNTAQNLILFQVAEAVASEEISPQVKNVIYYPSNGGERRKRRAEKQFSVLFVESKEEISRGRKEKRDGGGVEDGPFVL